MSLVLVLIGLGLLIVLVEFLFVPGTTVVGFIGFVSILIGFYFAFTDLGVWYGVGSVLLTGGLILLFFKLLEKSNYTKKIQLSPPSNDKIQHESNFVKVGDVGKTISRLAPMGKAMINNHIVEVTSLQEFIAEQKEIVVLEVNHNKIIVQINN